MPRFILNLPVTVGSLLIVLALLIFGGVWPDTASSVFDNVHSWVLDTFGWFYILSVTIFVVIAFLLGFGRFGSLKLGPDDSTPDYPFATWLAMLFAAGMGIGLMYYAVGEPMSHFIAPPTAEPRTLDAQREAMVSTFFHWGIHAWAVYGIVGLSLAYFGFRYNLPLTIRSGLYPLLKHRINGPIGHAIDIFAICSTLFGIATSLGLGILQINAGLAYRFDVPQTTQMHVILIVIVTAAASLSVVTGLDVGIRRLSELNLVLAIILMLFVLSVGSTTELLNKFVQNMGLYLSSIVPNSFNLYAYNPTDWTKTWTLFYWAWWIAWSPFVGMFIARISRGRTVREFVLGVLLVPAAFTCLWMTVFGNRAMSIDTGVAHGELGRAVEQDVSVALFRFFEYLPGSSVTSVLAILLISVFFVTSCDSGSLVVDTLASGGRGDTPALQRLFWCALSGAIAAILLVAGGLNALQTATIAAALPFAVIMLLLCLGLLRGMSADLAGRDVVREYHRVPGVAGGAPLAWRRRLGLMVRPPDLEDVERFLGDVVTPALQAVAAEFTSRGMTATVSSERQGVFKLTVPSESTRNFVYGVAIVSHPTPGFVLSAVSGRQDDEAKRWTATTSFTDGRRGYNIMGWSQDQIITDILDQFESFSDLTASPASGLFIGSPDPLPDTPAETV